MAAPQLLFFKNNNCGRAIRCSPRFCLHTFPAARCGLHASIAAANPTENL